MIGPAYCPLSVVAPPYIVYYTTQTDPTSGTANITSSPCYISQGFAGIGTSGDGAVLFGDRYDAYLAGREPPEQEKDRPQRAGQN